METEDIIKLSKEEILEKGFSEKQKWYAYRPYEDTLVAIDDRKQKRDVWGYRAGKSIPKDEVLQIISNIFESPRGKEVESATEIKEGNERKEVTEEQKVEETNEEILEQIGTIPGFTPSERVLWDNVTSDFLQTQRERLEKKNYRVEKVSDTLYQVIDNRGIQRDVQIDKDTGDVISCDCEKWYFNHTPLNPCEHMVFVHDKLMEDEKGKEAQEVGKVENKEKGTVMEKGEKGTGKVVKAKSTKPVVERRIGVLDFKKKGDFYEVQGKEEPGAWLVQEWSNEAQLSSEIIDWGQDEKHAYAHVRVYTPDGQHCDAVVNHDFAVARDVIILDLLRDAAKEGKKIIEKYDDEGKPILIDSEKRRALARYVRFRNFAVRDAATKATRIAQLKLLNKEWRENEEIEAERKEIEAVSSKS
jgi:tetrahydromethanopterin S-methyltransferase subunit G